MLMKLRIIPFKGSWLRIISYRHYEKMKKRNRFVNRQKHLHWIHLNFQNGAESHFQKLKNGYFFSKMTFFSENLIFCRLQKCHFFLFCTFGSVQMMLSWIRYDSIQLWIHYFLFPISRYIMLYPHWKYSIRYNYL